MSPALSAVTDFTGGLLLQFHLVANIAGMWHACEIYASRDRRYGGAEPNPLPAASDALPAGDSPQR